MTTDKPARRPTTGSRPALARPPRRRKPPGFLLVVAPPLALTVGVVAVAALHSALGLPLGAAWAAEVWGLAKTFLVASLSLAGFGGYVHRNNRQAWELAQGGQGQLPPDADGHSLSASRARATFAPGVTDTIRRRRTGRLTPVANESSQDDAEDAPQADTPPRQTGSGKGGAG